MTDAGGRHLIIIISLFMTSEIMFLQWMAVRVVSIMLD